MKKKLVSILLATAMVATLAGCGGSDAPAAEAPAAEEPAAEEPAAEEPAAEEPAAEEPAAEAPAAADGELAYNGNISIMHFSTSEESEGNGGSDGFRTCLAQWQDAHGNITLLKLPTPIGVLNLEKSIL